MTSKNWFTLRPYISLHSLLRWRDLKCMSDLSNPWKPVLAIDFSSWFPVLGVVEQNGMDDKLVSHDCLVMVDVGTTVRAKVAENSITRVAAIE
jgi:hypothetical protein